MHYVDGAEIVGGYYLKVLTYVQGEESANRTERNSEWSTRLAPGDLGVPTHVQRVVLPDYNKGYCVFQKHWYNLMKGDLGTNVFPRTLSAHP